MAWTARRASGPVIHWLSPDAVAMRPSRLVASLSVTRGRPVALRSRKPAWSCIASAAITPVGTAANGLPLYQFTYRGSDIVFEGVMAQDVLSHRPEAVTTLPGGVMAVDYGLLGIEMKRVN